jgi:hypothetical protein
MTSVAALCLYLLIGCVADEIPPTAPPLAHEEGHWVLYVMKNGQEVAQTYDSQQDCIGDSNILRDFMTPASVCYPLL